MIPLNKYFTGEEIQILASICINPTFRRAIAYYQHCRPAIIDIRTPEMTHTALTAATAHGWEEGGKFWEQFTAPPVEVEQEAEMPDLTSDLPNH